jgi:haloacetate dehalogenase
VSFDAFSRDTVAVPGGTVVVRRAGEGPAVLLLHGYPENSQAWRHVAPSLVGLDRGRRRLNAASQTVLAVDLPGYGDSTLSPTAFREGRVSKRMIGSVLFDAMDELGIRQCAVVGHDRGARVAYRMALDRPDRVRALAVLDVVPVLDVAEGLTYEAACEMGHWFWLSQPSTAPETLVGRDPDLYVRHILEAWGGFDVIEAGVVEDYVRCMRKPEVLRAIGAEYRAHQVDLAHDRTDRKTGRRIACPVLALWARGGLVERFGDPLAIWRRWGSRVEGGPLDSGHFLMEERPAQLIDRLAPFLAEALGDGFAN